MPRHVITDQGRQFLAVRFRRWCRRRRIRQRFGAVGKYGSIVVVERFIRTMKNECTRRILVPLQLATFQREILTFADWYNSHRPHEALAGRTPDETYYARRPACLRSLRSHRRDPRDRSHSSLLAFQTARFLGHCFRWHTTPHATPNVLVRGHSGAVLDLDVRFHADRKHLPLVQIR